MKRRGVTLYPYVVIFTLGSTKRRVSPSFYATYFSSLNVKQCFTCLSISGCDRVECGLLYRVKVGRPFFEGRGRVGGCRGGVEGFSVVTRVSRNGSALTSHLLRVAKILARHRVRRRVLSGVRLRERHNVAVGTHTIGLVCGTGSNKRCVLGLVSAPNRISFGCRISEDLTTYRKTVLIISTTRKVRTRALTGACLTVRRSLRLIPIVGGVSLPDTRPRVMERRVRSIVNVGTSITPLVSTGGNVGIRRILREVIRLIPPPSNSYGGPLGTLVFSSCCSDCGNIVICMEIVSKALAPNAAVGVVTANTRFSIIRMNCLRPAKVLSSGRVGTNRIKFVTTDVGGIRRIRMNSAMAATRNKTSAPLPNCGRIGPVICDNVCPSSKTECSSLHSTLRGLRLGSTTLDFRTRASITLNFNFHYKFLKLLRVRVVRRHLRERCGLSLIAATPSIRCGIVGASGAIRDVSGPAGLPRTNSVRCVRRPVIRTSVVSPGRCINDVVRLYRREQNGCLSVRCLSRGQMALGCSLPLGRVVCSFFSTLGSEAQNCTSFSCRFGNCRQSGLIGLSVLLGNSTISTLSFVIRGSGTCTENEEVTRGLGRSVPHRLFRVPVRTTMNKGVVTERAIQTVHGSILTGYCNNSVAQGGGLLRGRGRNGGHVHRINAIRIPRRTFVSILGLSWCEGVCGGGNSLW